MPTVASGQRRKRDGFMHRPNRASSGAHGTKSAATHGAALDAPGHPHANDTDQLAQLQLRRKMLQYARRVKNFKLRRKTRLPYLNRSIRETPNLPFSAK